MGAGEEAESGKDTAMKPVEEVAKTSDPPEKAPVAVEPATTVTTVTTTTVPAETAASEKPQAANNTEKNPENIPQNTPVNPTVNNPPNNPGTNPENNPVASPVIAEDQTSQSNEDRDKDLPASQEKKDPVPATGVSSGTQASSLPPHPPKTGETVDNCDESATQSLSQGFPVPVQLGGDAITMMYDYQVASWDERSEILKRKRKMSVKARESLATPTRSSPRAGEEPSTKFEANLTSTITVEYQDTVRLPAGVLDVAPWRMPDMAKVKLKAYRDPNGRFRVFDPDGKVIRKEQLNKYRDEDELMDIRRRTNLTRSEEEIIFQRGMDTDPSEKRTTRSKIRTSSSPVRTEKKERSSLSSEVQQQPIKKRRAKGPKLTMRKNSKNSVRSSSSKSTPIASPSKLKRKISQPLKVTEETESSPDGTGAATEEGLKLFEAVFARPRTPGKRQPKADADRTVKLFSNLPESPASEDKDFVVSEHDNEGSEEDRVSSSTDKSGEKEKTTNAEDHQEASFKDNTLPPVDDEGTRRARVESTESAFLAGGGGRESRGCSFGGGASMLKYLSMIKPVWMVLIAIQIAIVVFRVGPFTRMNDVQDPFIHLDSIPTQGVSHDPDILKQVLARKGEIPHLNQVARTVLKPGQVATQHFHPDMYEVFYVLAGNGTFYLDDHAFEMSAGACFRVAPPHLHKIAATGSSDVVIMGIAIQA